MSLRFIYGRAGTGKSYYCLNEIKEKMNRPGKKRNHGALILLVPEQFSLQAERNLLAVTGQGGNQVDGSLATPEVLSFGRMAYRIFNEVGGITRHHIHPAGKCMLMYRIVEQVREQLSFFSGAADAGKVGFVNTLCTTISEMKRYNISPQQLMDFEDDSETNQLLKEKMRDIGILFDTFEKALHQKYIDSDDDLTMMADRLDHYSKLEGAEIWLDEFSGFTPQEYLVIEKLLKKVERVNICVCTDCLIDEQDMGGTGVFAPAKNTVKRLLKMAREHGIVVEPPIALNEKGSYRFKSSSELGHLEQYYFNFPYRVYAEPTKDITIFSAVNIYSEVEDTARNIISMCRDQGLRYRDIAVVTRNLQAYDKLIKVIFDQYHIPYFIDQKRAISSHPLIALVLSALEIFEKNWSYETVFRYLKTGLTNIPIEDIDIIENYVLAAGIRGSAWTKGERWESIFNTGMGKDQRSAYEVDMLERVNDIRQRVVEPLINFRARTKGRNKADVFCTALFDLLNELGVAERIEAMVDMFKKSGELNIANEYAQIWNITMTVLDQIVDVMKDESFTLGTFGHIIDIGFQEYRIGLIPPSLDQVLVGSIERSRSHEVAAVFILGVNDGVFPAVNSDEGIISDHDRAVLRSKGIELAPDTRTQVFEEQYLIYTALTTAGKYLRLSYPVADHEGRAMRPSTIISRIKKMFPQLTEESNIVQQNTAEDDMRMVSAAIPTFNALIAAMRQKYEGGDVQPLWLDTYQWYNLHKDWKEKCKKVLAGLRYTGQIHYIPPEKTRKLYGNPIYSSVSRLEKFASCPFAFYVQYGLRAKERKIFKLQAPDEGTFIHDVMQQFSRSLKEKDMTWRNVDREWCLGEVSDIVDTLVNKNYGAIFRSSQRYRYFSKRLKRILGRAIWLVAEHIRRSGFEPLGYEMSFDDYGDFPPITLELPDGGQVKLVGRIDRIDTMHTEQGTFLRIIDYKSGTKAFKLSDVYYGLQIQLMVYLDALWENGGGSLSKPILPGGVLYFKIDDPIVRGTGKLEQEEIEKQIMKQLKMKGLLLADVKLIREMDHEINGDSLIIPARINKGDTLGRSSVATAGQFEVIRRHVKRLLTQLCEEIVKGNVSITPYKKKKFTSCMYCNYASVCQFDTTLPDNRYRILNEVKDEDVWKLMED